MKGLTFLTPTQNEAQISYFLMLLSFHDLCSNDFSHMVAEEYLSYFNFSGMMVDQALR